MSSVLTIPDIVGYCGVALIVSTYFFSQVGRMDSTRTLYPALNAIGALLILYSLAHRPNPPSIVIEFFWLAISAIGLVRRTLKKKALKSQAPL